MGQDPREAWRRLQKFAVDRSGGRGPNIPGGPKGLFGGAAGLVVLGAAGIFISNALFNGILGFLSYTSSFPLTDSSGRWSPSDQVYENRWCTEGDFQRRY